MMTKLRGLRMLGPTANVLVNKVTATMLGTSEKARDQFTYSKERVDRRLARTPDRPDLWTKIPEEGDHNSGTGLTLHEHYSVASLFMLAGSETTATALTGTTYHLLRNPQHLDRLTSEICSTFSASDSLASGNPTLESLARLKSCQAWI